MRFLGVIAIMGSLLVPVGAIAAEGGDQATRQIAVTGQGLVDAQPDMAIVNLGVSHQDKTARGAMDKTNTAMADMMALLTREGIAARDVQTNGLSLHPIWQNRRNNDEQPVIAGYQAGNQVTIRVRDLDQLGALLDAVISQGVNQLNGIEFAIQDPTPLKEQARKNAVKDARAKAGLFAVAAGVKLGKVLSIHEPGAQTGPRPLMGYADMAESRAGVPVAGGEIQTQARVSIIYEIRD